MGISICGIGSFSPQGAVLFIHYMFFTTFKNIFEDKLIEIKTNLNTELNKLNTDNLKDKCKELGILGISKLKKPELIQALENEFLKMLPVLKEKKMNDLKNIYKLTGVKRGSQSKKESLVYQILLYYSIMQRHSIWLRYDSMISLNYLINSISHRCSY